MSDVQPQPSFRLLIQPAPEYAHILGRIEWMINLLLGGDSYDEA